MGDEWDWRQKYAQYADTQEPQSSPYSAPPPPPQGPDAPAPDQQPYAAPYGPPQPYVQQLAPQAVAYGQAPGYGQVQGNGKGQGYGQAYAGPYPQFAGYPAPPVATQAGRGFSIAAFICGGLALLFLPILLGPLGIIFGFVAHSKGDKIGRVAAVMSIATTALGMAISAWVTHRLGVRFGG